MKKFLLLLALLAVACQDPEPQKTPKPKEKKEIAPPQKAIALNAEQAVAIIKNKAELETALFIQKAAKIEDRLAVPSTRAALTKAAKDQLREAVQAQLEAFLKGFEATAEYPPKHGPVELWRGSRKDPFEAILERAVKYSVVVGEHKSKDIPGTMVVVMSVAPARALDLMRLELQSYLKGPSDGPYDVKTRSRVKSALARQLARDRETLSENQNQMAKKYGLKVPR